MISNIRRLLSFGLMVAVLVGAISVLNWIPSVVTDGTLKKYKSLEEARKSLHIKRIFVPSFLPENLGLSWPPTEIYAQTKPYTLIITHFGRGKTEDPALAVEQVDIREKNYPDLKLKIQKVTGESRIVIKNREARAVSGSCADDRQCAEISWIEGDYFVRVRAECGLRDITRIAQSMIAE